jgi:hypothetical protein
MAFVAAAQPIRRQPKAVGSIVLTAATPLMPPTSSTWLYHDALGHLLAHLTSKRAITLAIVFDSP